MEEEVNSEIHEETQIGIQPEQVAEQEPPQKSIPTNELIEEQQRRPMCREYAAMVGFPNYDFDFDENHILVRKLRLEGALQKVIPQALSERVINLFHSQILQGHVGESRLYPVSYTHLTLPTILLV